MSPKNLKIIFAGTPEFSVPTLQTLINSSHEIVGVFTQPDRPAGRGQKLTASPIKQLALQHQLPIFQPKTLRDPEIQETIKKLNCDLMIVIAYGLILPTAVLEIPPLGCINVHASLLPRWRGAAPIQHAILAGDTETGITIMQMEAGLDTGPMLLQNKCVISANETSATLHDKLAQLGADSLMQALEKLPQLTPITQDEQFANYAAKIEKSSAEIHWQQPAINILRQINAYNPWPVAFTYYQEKIIRIWEAQALITPEFKHAKPGEVININREGIDVLTSNGIIKILKLQLPGGKPLSVAEILNGKSLIINIGDRFENLKHE